MNRAALILLLLAAPAFGDTIYTLSGGTADTTETGIVPGPLYSFSYNATIGRLLDTETYPGIPGEQPANWPFPIWSISFYPVTADAQPSTGMDLGMSDWDGEPIMVSYEFIGFMGDFGTYTGINSEDFGCSSDPTYCEGGYGTPGLLTLTVTDPPSSVPEPDSILLLGGGGMLLALLSVSRKRQWVAAFGDRHGASHHRPFRSIPQA